jgi:predicted RND superfamily exporter protein
VADAPLSGLWRWTAGFSARRARPILAVTLVTSLALGYFLLGIEADTDLDTFVRPAARDLADAIEEDFDEGGVLSLVFESRGDRSLLEPDLLHRQLRIIQELKRRYEVETLSLVEGIDSGLRRVKRKSLLEFDEYTPMAEGILALAGGRTVRDLEKASRHMVSHPEAIAFYAKLRIAFAMGVTMEGPGARETTYATPYVKAIKAYVRLDSSYSDEDRKQILQEIPPLIQSMAGPELAVYAVNDQLLSLELDRRSRQNAALLGLTALLVDTLCLWLLFRSRRELLIVVTILGTASVWSFGIAGMIGMPLSFFHLVALPILLGTGIDDTLVFGRRLAEERAKGAEFPQALRATFGGAGNAILLTTFTTLIAFLITGLTAPTEVVESFFLFVALSMVIVFVLSTFLQGAIRAELERRDRAVGRSEPSGHSSALENVSLWLARGSRRCMERPRVVLVGSALLFVVAVGFATRLESAMSREDLVRGGMQTYDATMALEKYFGENRVGFLLIQGEVENPLLLAKLKLLQQRLSEREEIEQVLKTANVDSIINLMDKLDIPVTPEMQVRAVFDEISSNERTANYVLDRSYREAAEHVLHRNGDGYDGLIMRFYSNGGDTRAALAATRAIEEELAALEIDSIPGLRIRLGGGDVAYSIESLYYVELLVRSFLMSLVANWFVLLLVWRRPLPALIASMPVIFAVTVIVGWMGGFGIQLKFLSVAVGAIAVGLGIDYPIHLIERFQEERRKGLAPFEASNRALATMGPHVLTSALTTVVGFGAACVLALPLAVSFGVLTAAAIGLVYLASIFVLPVLLVRWGDRATFGPRPPHARREGSEAS